MSVDLKLFLPNLLLNSDKTVCNIRIRSTFITK